jgi:hypothetical protein
MGEVRSPVLDGLWVRVGILNQQRPEIDATDEAWRAWFAAHIAAREEIEVAGELAIRGVPAQIGYFRRKIEELDRSAWHAARTGYWNT